MPRMVSVRFPPQHHHTNPNEPNNLADTEYINHDIRRVGGQYAAGTDNFIPPPIRLNS